MPALTITAVDHTTDQLTIIGHGILNGAGPGALRNIGGALPAEFAPVTDYWVIVDDADTIRIAASSSDAIAGTAIAITDNGSGTHILELGIPYRRARTYGALSQLKSADLNAMQDSLKALHALLTGQAQSIWTDLRYFTTPERHPIPAALSLDPNGTHTRFGGGNGWTLAGSTNRIVYPIVLPVGARITSWELYLDKASSGAHTIAGRLYRSHEDGTEEALASGTTNNQNAPNATLLSENADVGIVEQWSYYLVLTPAAGGAGDKATHAVISWTRPPG